MNRIFAGLAACIAIVGLIAVAYGDGPQNEDIAGGRVIGLRGYPIAAQNPADGQVLTYVANSKNYVPATPTVSGGSGISGLTSGQLGVAGSATTLTSSAPFGLTGNSTIVETTTGGLLTPSILPLATDLAIGGMKGDGTTVTCVAGVCSAIGGAATSVVVGTTTVGSGTTGQFLYDNAGTLGNKTIACADLSNGATGCSTATGTSGATIPLLNGTNTWSAANGFTSISASGQITSTATTGTAPLVIASTTNVANLNASSLNGATMAAPGAIGGGTPGSAAHTTISATGQITSTLATGTAPFVVASTTNVANLNASSLSGATFAAPGAIGGGTPSSAAHTTISATGQITSTLATGTAPFVVASTTNVANLNASTLTGNAVGTSGATIGLLNANKTDSGTNSFTGANNTFTAMAGVINTLTISTATFTPALASGINQAATLVHASCPCTIANPSDTSSHIGQTGVLVVTQSATGSDTVGTWGSQYVTPGGTSGITLSTGANVVDYLPYYVADATHVVLGPVIKGPTH